VGQLVLAVLVEAQVGWVDAELAVVVDAALFPVLEPLGLLLRVDEELHFHLLKLGGAEDEGLGDNLVAEGFAHLRDPKRHFDAAGGHHVLEVDKNTLRRFRAQINRAGRFFHGAYMGGKHEVELAGLAEGVFFAAGGAGPLCVNVVGAETATATLAFH
jgi:hypothetical protein